MKKKTIESKTKFTTNTYMREALQYEISIFSHEDYFVTVKKYLKMSSPFIINNMTLIDNNYFVVEITPLNEHYNIRYYVTPDKKIIDYYIDMTLYNGVKYKIPYYVDLYLDIVHYPETNTYAYCDQNELESALKEKLINKKDYNLAYKTGNKLLNEIQSKSNKYLNIDILKYLN